MVLEVGEFGGGVWDGDGDIEGNDLAQAHASFGARFTTFSDEQSAVGSIPFPSEYGRRAYVLITLLSKETHFCNFQKKEL